VNPRCMAAVVWLSVFGVAQAGAAITKVDEAMDLSKKTGRPVLAVVGHET
jgi:hypothetical protein